MKQESQITHYTSDTNPAFATLIIKNNQTILKEVFGSAVLENGKCKTKATLDTPFALCSITKHFTAAAILLLEEKGLLSIEHEISKYIPGLPESFNGIKIKHLIFHISGIPNYTNIPGVLDIKSNLKKCIVYDQETTLKLILSLQPTGYSKNFEYCNSGYTLLAEIIYNVSGVKFAQFLKTYFFDRFGMKNSFLIADMDNHTGYTHQYSAWPLFSLIEWPKVFHINGEGGIFMSLNDYEKWINAFDNNQIFNSELTMDKFLSIGSFDDNTNVPGMLGVGFYGFGLTFNEEERNGKTCKTISHGGGMPGSASFFKKITTDNDSIWVIYLNNAGSYVDPFELLEQANIIF